MSYEADYSVLLFWCFIIQTTVLLQLGGRSGARIRPTGEGGEWCPRRGGRLNSYILCISMSHILDKYGKQRQAKLLLLNIYICHLILVFQYPQYLLGNVLAARKFSLVSRNNNFLSIPVRVYIHWWTKLRDGRQFPKYLKKY